MLRVPAYPPYNPWSQGPFFRGSRGFGQPATEGAPPDGAAPEVPAPGQEQPGQPGPEDFFRKQFEDLKDKLPTPSLETTKSAAFGQALVVGSIAAVAATVFPGSWFKPLIGGIIAAYATGVVKDNPPQSS